MSTFLQTSNNDLALAVNSRGRKALVLERDRVVAGTIKLYNRFQFWEGEWFLDIRLGVPYYRAILVKSPDMPIVARIFRQVILGVPVIASIQTFTFDYEPTTRSVDFTFEARASDGRKVSGGAGKPFIVDGRELTTRDRL